MSRALNSLKTSDVITTPLKLKYTSSYDCSTIAAYGISVLTGINGPVTVTGSVAQETINYISIRSSFYSNYLTGSIPQSASAVENYLQSTAAIGSDDADIRYFPTESGAKVKAISIPTGVYGQQISKNSFILSSSAYYIVDDANGNIIDTANGRAHVGNIIYGQGIVILTNPDYQDIFAPTPPTAVDDTAVFKDVDTPKIIDILANDISGSCPLDTTSVVLSGSNSVYYTVNLNGTITLNTSVPGSYDVYYTVESLCPSPGVCPIPSNQALVTVTVLETAWRPIDPYCVQATTTTTTTTSTTTTTTTLEPTTTSTTSTTTTAEPTTTTSTTTSTTTEEPTTTTSTTSTTTTLEPTTTTTSTTSTTTTEEPTTTTSTTTSTTTEEPTTTTSTTSTTTTEEPTTTTSTTTSTTTAEPTTTTTSTTTSTTTGALINYEIRLYDTACELLGSTVIFNGIYPLNVNQFYPTNGLILPGNIVEVLTLTASASFYSTSITGSSYLTCGDVP